MSASTTPTPPVAAATTTPALAVTTSAPPAVAATTTVSQAPKVEIEIEDAGSNYSIVASVITGTAAIYGVYKKLEGKTENSLAKVMMAGAAGCGTGFATYYASEHAIKFVKRRRSRA